MPGHDPTTAWVCVDVMVPVTTGSHGRAGPSAWEPGSWFCCSLAVSVGEVLPPPGRTGPSGMAMAGLALIWPDGTVTVEAETEQFGYHPGAHSGL